MHWKATARHHRLQEKVFEPTEQEKVLLVIETDQFAKHTAQDEFEETLEVVASVVLWLDQHGCATGLVTNGAMTGGHPPVVPITRNPGQLPSMLEVLARLRMEPAEALLEILRRGPALPWGTSCLYFALMMAVQPGPRASTSPIGMRRSFSFLALSLSVGRGGPRARAFGPGWPRDALLRSTEKRLNDDRKKEHRFLPDEWGHGAELALVLATFSAFSIMGRPSFWEGLERFSCRFLTHLSIGRKWRVIYVLVVQAAGLACAAGGWCMRSITDRIVS
jgi:hypothetical protein